MEHFEDHEFDDLVDRLIGRSTGRDMPGSPDDADDREAAYQHLGSEIVRVLAQESPRLSSSAHAQHLATLRSRAAAKRKASATNLGWLRRAAPRWAQVAAVALVVVIMANGITVASAGSLPGSPLYPVKRLAEQSNILLATTPGERAGIWMNLAGRRLDEVQRLLATEPHVDAIAMDDIDESILRALTEVASTRGTERIALLQQIIELSVREQTVLDELAQNAPSDDRDRFEQTARLMEDVAHIAGTAQSSLGTPISTPTRTSTSTSLPTLTETESPTETGTSEPTDTEAPAQIVPATDSPPVENDVQQAPAGESPTAETKSDGEGQNRRPAATSQPSKTGPPESGDYATPAPSKSQSPEREPTDNPVPTKSSTRDN